MEEQKTATEGLATGAVADAPARSTTGLPAEKPCSAVPAGLPAGINLGEGFEGLCEGDFQLSRAKIVQSSTPEFKSNPKEFTLGSVIDNITLRTLPNEFIPIMRFVNWIRFNPRKKEDPNFDPAYDAGKIIWISSDPFDPRVVAEGAFGPNGEKPKATKFINFLCLFPGERLPVILSFSKTSLKAGVKVLNLALRAGGNLYDFKYRLSTHLEGTNDDTYFVADVESAGKVEDATVLQAKAFRQFFGSIIKKVEEAVVSANAGDEAPAAQEAPTAPIAAEEATVA